MMRTINNQLVDEIIESSDIVDIISADLELFKKGANYVGLCPFHDDNNPSFTVSPDKKIYKCFVCQEGGNVITYMQKKHNLTFKETVVELGAKLGINVNIGVQPVKNNAHNVLADVVNYYHTILTTLSSGTEAYSYLEQRGYSIELINHFQLGYAPKDNHLRQYLSSLSDKNEQYSLFDIDNSGVIDGEREFFNNRIIVPIFDDYSRPVGFSARTLTDEQPKYLNTRDSDVFQKRNLLYNFNHAKRHIVDGQLIFVEGFFDVFALHKVEIKNVVGLMGTAFGQGHISLLKKYKIKSIIMILDQDDAGIKSTIKIADMLISQGINTIKVVVFTNHKDIDEVVQSGENPNTLIKNAIDYFEFKLDNYLVDNEINTVNEKRALIDYFLVNISNVDRTNQTFMLSKIANVLSLSLDEVKQLYNIDNTKIAITPNNYVIDPNTAPVNYDNDFIPPEIDYHINTHFSKNEDMVKSSAYKGPTDEDVCIAYSLITINNFHKVELAYEKEFIKFIKHEDLFKDLRIYYKSHDGFNIIDFIDFSKKQQYFDICQKLIYHPYIDFSKINLILNSPHKKIPPGRDLVRRKRQ